MLSTPPAFVLSQDQTLRTKQSPEKPTTQPPPPTSSSSHTASNPNQKTTQKQKTGINNKHTIEFTNNTHTPTPNQNDPCEKRPPPQPQGRGDKRKHYPDPQKPSNRPRPSHRPFGEEVFLDNPRNLAAAQGPFEGFVIYSCFAVHRIRSPRSSAALSAGVQAVSSGTRLREGTRRLEHHSQLTRGDAPLSAAVSCPEGPERRTKGAGRKEAGDETHEAVRTGEDPSPIIRSLPIAALPRRLPPEGRRAPHASPPPRAHPHQRTRRPKRFRRLAAPRKPLMKRPAQRASSPVHSPNRVHASTPRIEATIRIRTGNEQRPEPGLFARLRPHAVDHRSPPPITEWRRSHLRVADSGQPSRVRVAATRFEAIASCALGNGLRTQCPSMSS